MADPGDVSLIPFLLPAGLGGALSAGGLWAYSVFSPRCGFWSPVVRSLPQSNAVGLTFDDGPHAEFTPRVLDILAEHQVTASFFVIGRFAREQPAIVRRIFEEGHSLGNHSLDHEHFGVNRPRGYWDRQLGETQKIVADITGRLPLLFRPPMGFKTRHIAAAARGLRLPVVGWSLRGWDAGKKGVQRGELSRRILKRVGGHDIVLLHDGVEPFRPAGSSQAATVEALPAILRGLAEKELRAVSLVEALVAGSEDLKAAAARAKRGREHEAPTSGTSCQAADDAGPDSDGLYLGTLCLALAGYVVLLGPFFVVAGVSFDRRRRMARVAARGIFPRLVRHCCRVWGRPLAVDGGGVDFSETGPCIVVSNHVSSLDALMLMQLPGGVGDGRIWSKGWPFRTPLLGALMRLAGHLRVEDFNLLPEARDCLSGGETMLVFPESSRSRTGKLGRFRDGAFLLAVRTGRPVVPVAIHGTFECFPPGQAWVYRPVLRVEVLGVLKADGAGEREHVILKQRAHGMIAAALAGKRLERAVRLAAAS